MKEYILETGSISVPRGEGREKPIHLGQSETNNLNQWTTDCLVLKESI
jgi:hypothetical protein